MSVREIVKLTNLNIYHNNNALVNNVSLTINEGEIFGLVGESGSGKTLTAKMLINLLPENLKYTADEVMVAGENLLNISAKKRKSIIGTNIGYIPQNTTFFLHPMIKIKNQIGDGFIYHKKKSKIQAMNKAVEILGKIGFPDPNLILNYYPWQLSGGMRQRVNIAMALMNDPKLILADEPTTALDSTIQRQVADLFKTINKELGISILMISHDLGLIKNYCSSLAVMYAGRIAEKGSSKDVFSNPKHPYTKLLIKIIPSMDIKKSEPLAEIPGYVPDTGRDIQGCVFKDRCPEAMNICGFGVKEHTNHNHYYRCNLK